MNFCSTLGDFKVGVSVGVYCTKCTLNTGVNTNFEITHCQCSACRYPSALTTTWQKATIHSSFKTKYKC
jgi:hypothetical protein